MGPGRWIACGAGGGAAANSGESECAGSYAGGGGASGWTARGGGGGGSGWNAAGGGGGGAGRNMRGGGAGGGVKAGGGAGSNDGCGGAVGPCGLPAVAAGAASAVFAAQSGHSLYDGGTSRPHCGQIHVNMCVPHSYFNAQ